VRKAKIATYAARIFLALWRNFVFIFIGKKRLKMLTYIQYAALFIRLLPIDR